MGFCFGLTERTTTGTGSLVNDRVMRASGGRFKIDENSRMVFYGKPLCVPTTLELAPGDLTVGQVRGDGGEYSLNLFTPRRPTGFS